MSEATLRAGRSHSGEQSWARGGGIRCAEAGASSGGGGGTFRAKTRAHDGAKLIGHRAGATNQRGRAPASANSLCQGKIRATRAREHVPHLRTALGKTWRGVWCSGWAARWALSSDELWRRWLSMREGESG
jgi:hypothetical protein